MIKKPTVKQIEAKARKLMNGKWDGKKLSMLYYYILEDANYHSENARLTRLGAFGKFKKHHYETGDVYVPVEYSDEAREAYEEYRKAGGKTWEL